MGRAGRLALVIVALVCAGACDDAQRTSVTFAGSSTLSLLTLPALGDAFAARHGVAVKTVSAQGSGEAVEAVADGRAGIGGLSRSLLARESFLKPYALIIGYDAIAVFVHASNPVWALERAQVEGVFTGRIRNWKELGGRDAPIEIVLEPLDETHATLQFFRSEVLQGKAFGEHVTKADKLRVLEHVAQTPNAVAFAPLGAGRMRVHPIAVDAIAPSHENVVSGAYPLSRSLVLVANGLPKGHERAFFEFVVSQEGQELVAERHVPVLPLVDAPTVGASLRGRE